MVSELTPEPPSQSGEPSPQPITPERLSRDHRPVDLCRAGASPLYPGQASTLLGRRCLLAVPVELVRGNWLGLFEPRHRSQSGPTVGEKAQGFCDSFRQIAAGPRRRLLRGSDANRYSPRGGAPEARIVSSASGANGRARRTQGQAFCRYCPALHSRNRFAAPPGFCRSLYNKGVITGALGDYSKVSRMRRRLAPWARSHRRVTIRRSRRCGPRPDSS